MSTQIHPDRFIGFPVSHFQIWERRSLTVHLEDAGKFDVFAEPSPNDPDATPNAFERTYVGRYDSFLAASQVADGLNRVWRACPQSTAAEIVAFVGRHLQQFPA